MNDAVRRGRLVLLVNMVALEGRWEEKKKTTATKWYIYRRGWLNFFFLSFFLLFWFGLWFLTVALLAWRVVFCFGRGWVGLGLEFIIQHRENLPSTGLQVHVTFSY